LPSVLINLANTFPSDWHFPHCHLVAGYSLCHLDGCPCPVSGLLLNLKTVCLKNPFCYATTSFDWNHSHWFFWNFPCGPPASPWRGSAYWMNLSLSFHASSMVIGSGQGYTHDQWKWKGQQSV
jgi:hypothetical protein